jgi:hypothetical protein
MHHLLDRFPDRQQLSSVPTQLWLILSLEICISDSFGCYLLLTYPSYGIASPTSEGHWAPPFLGYPVETGYDVAETVGAVRRHFEHAEQYIDLQNAVHQLAYLLGLSSAEIERVGNFTELKSSPRVPEQTKCYKIIRFRLRSVSARNFRNLADPECRKGYVFIPLDAVAENRLKLHKKCPGELFYLGKPIMSNVKVVLGDESERRSMAASAIALDTALFYGEHQGLLISADLSGYGNACQYATSQMHSFNQSGSEIAASFRGSIASVFYEFLCAVGILQVHMAGDGFLAAIPEPNCDGNRASSITCILDAYAVVLSRVSELNERIVDPKMKVGSRLAIHCGRYRFGRIALARSFTADFDGAAIIEVARLEQGLAAATKGRADIDPEFSAIVGAKHTIAISKAVGDEAMSTVKCRTRTKFVGELTLGAKETSIRASVFVIEEGQPQ